MLLGLTLALLWSATCWAQDMYGFGGGKYFSTPSDCEIKGIQVAVGLLGLMKSIQVKCGDSWSPVFGVSGGTTQKFILDEGEHIYSIYGSYMMYIRFLSVATNKGRYAVFGQESGNTFTSAREDGKVLVGICGQYKPFGISALCFHWDYPPEVEGSTEQPTAGAQSKQRSGRSEGAEKS